MDDFISAARAISDPTRLRILQLLQPGELCVCHITEQLDVGQPTVSRHLGALRAAGLVLSRRDGQWVYYRLADDAAVTTCSLDFLALVCRLLPAAQDNVPLRESAHGSCCQVKAEAAQ